MRRRVTGIDSPIPRYRRLDTQRFVAPAGWPLRLNAKPILDYHSQIPSTLPHTAPRSRSQVHAPIANRPLALGRKPSRQSEMKDLATIAGPALVALAFGGSLVPSVRDANQKALELLSDQSKLGSSAPSRRSSDERVLGCSPWLGYPAPLYIADVCDVVGRFSAGSLSLDEARLLRREEFKGRLGTIKTRAPQLRGTDSALLAGPSARASSGPPPALAFDATWAALSGGSPYVSAQEAERQLSRWRPSPDVFVVAEFEKSLLQGRALVALAYVVLFGLQGLVLCILVLQPLIEVVSAP